MSYERPVTILASSLDRGMKTELCCLLDEVVLEVVIVLKSNTRQKRGIQWGAQGLIATTVWIFISSWML